MFPVTIKDVEYDADPDSLSFDEAIRIEQVTGQTYQEWLVDWRHGRPAAWKSMAFVLLCRDNPELRFDDMGSLKFSDLDFERATSDPGPVEPGEGEPVDPTGAAS